MNKSQSDGLQNISYYFGLLNAGKGTIKTNGKLAACEHFLREKACSPSLMQFCPSGGQMAPSKMQWNAPEIRLYVLYVPSCSPVDLGQKALVLEPLAGELYI